MSRMDALSRVRDRRDRCGHVQQRLHRIVDGSMPAWRERRLMRHVDECEACAAELARQRQVHAGLDGLTSAVPVPPAPPPDLLASILSQVEEPGVRQRLAAPARGAVSGARPELSVALGLTTVALALFAGWIGWKLGQAWAEQRRQGD